MVLSPTGLGDTVDAHQTELDRRMAHVVGVRCERRVLRIGTSCGSAGNVSEATRTKRGKPTSKLILPWQDTPWEKGVSHVSFPQTRSRRLHQAAIRLPIRRLAWPRHSRMIEGASLSTALEPPLCAISMPELAMTTLGRCPSELNLSIAARVQAGRRRLLHHNLLYLIVGHLLYFFVS